MEGLAAGHRMIVLWSESESVETLDEIRRNLMKIKDIWGIDLPEIRTISGRFTLLEQEEYRNAELIFAYFKGTGEEFCRFLIERRKFADKTVFLFGASFDCFDRKKVRDYYRLGTEEFSLLTHKKDVYYEKGLRELIRCIFGRLYGTTNVDSLTYG